MTEDVEVSASGSMQISEDLKQFDLTIRVNQDITGPDFVIQLVVSWLQQYADRNGVAVHSTFSDLQ